MEIHLEQVDSERAKAIYTKVRDETETNFQAAFNLGLEDIITAEAITQEEGKEAAQAVDEQSAILAHAISEKRPTRFALSANKVGAALSVAQSAITSSVSFLGMTRMISEVVATYATGTRISLVDLPPVLRNLHDQNRLGFETSARWHTVGAHILRDTGVLLNCAGYALGQTMTSDSQPSLGWEEFNYLNWHGPDPLDVSLITTAQSGSIAETIIKILNDGNNISDVARQHSSQFIATHRAWRGTHQLTRGRLFFFGPAGQKEVPEKRISKQELDAESRGLEAAHEERTEDFRLTWAQVQKLQLRPFSNVLHLADMRGELNRAEEGEMTPETARRLTGLLHVLEIMGKQPETLNERLAALAYDEYVTGLNLQLIQTKLQEAGEAAESHDWMPVTRDLEFLLANWTKLQPHLLNSWVPTDTTTPDAVNDIRRSLTAFRKSRLKTQHPELGFAQAVPAHRQTIIDALHFVAAAEFTKHEQRRTNKEEQ